MEYVEYIGKASSSEKRLGILGEVHIFDENETRMAEHIVPEYDTIAGEGIGHNPFFVNFASFLSVPLFIAYTLGIKNRTLDNRTTEDIAKSYGKKIVELENLSKSFSPLQKAAFVTQGAVKSLISPFLFINLKLFGDPNLIGSKAYEIEEKRKKENGFFYRLENYPLHSVRPKRDKNMAETAIEYFRNHNENLLISCGRNHLEGIVRNFESERDLEETANYSVNDFFKRF